MVYTGCTSSSSTEQGGLVTPEDWALGGFQRVHSSGDYRLVV